MVRKTNVQYNGVHCPMSQQMKDLAEDGDTKLNQVLERLDELERLIAELRNKMV